MSSFKHQLKRWLCAALTRCFGDRNGRVLLPALSGPGRGLRFRLDLTRPIEFLYFTGAYESACVRHLARILQKGWVVWDCGAYIGYYTNLFAGLVGESGKVVAFEPDPRNLARVRENTALNGHANVQFVHSAIGLPCRETDFVLSDNTNSHIPGTYVGADREEYKKIERSDEIIRVACMSLDEAAGSADIPAPDLIKIDIDGAERHALKHSHELVSKTQPLIAVESHNPECDAAIWEFAEREHYSLRQLPNWELVGAREQVGGTMLCAPLERNS